MPALLWRDMTSCPSVTFDLGVRGSSRRQGSCCTSQASCAKASSPRRVELRALRKVCEGEELTVSYVDFLDTSAERQRKLRERFHFHCTCQHCSQHIKDDMMTAAADGADEAQVGGGDGG